MKTAKIFVLMMGLFTIGCVNQPSLNPGASYTILYLTEDGENLFDPVLRIFNADNIKVYYLINGEKIEKTKNSYNGPLTFQIVHSESDDAKCFRIQLNTEEIPHQFTGEYRTTTIVDFGLGKEDTIQVLLKVNTTDNIEIKEGWYNGKPIEELRGHSYDFSVIKDIQ